MQKGEAAEKQETIEPPKPEKKKTRKGKKGGASPEDEEDDDGEGQVDEDRNGEQKDKKVRAESVFDLFQVRKCIILRKFPL